jgi:hypothetical protein
MLLEDLTIVIPTFHRRGYLKSCLEGIAKNLPECSVVVVSDDGVAPEFAGLWNSWLTMAYDTGLTGKRNFGVQAVRTPYTLMGSDDFDFSTREARIGIVQMTKVLKYNTNIDVVVGRHNNRDYHGYLEYKPGEYIKEHRLDMLQTPPIMLRPHVLWEIDIGPNYFAARTSVLRTVKWDETIRPIGGEHADWFLDLKEADMVVAYLSLANINEQPSDPSKQHPAYHRFRNRCWDGHALFMKKRGIKKYYGFDEEVK